MVKSLSLVWLIAKSMAHTSPIRIMSYNCRGLNSIKREFVNTILPDCTFLFVQEHWQSVSQLCDLGTINNNYLAHGVCGFDNNAVMAGRPYGGCAIFWNKCVEGKVLPVSVESRRIAAIKVCTPSYSLLLINVYMPCEDGSSETCDEFCTVLSCIESLLATHCDCCPILAGDFNVDLSRHSRHRILLSDFLSRCDFICSQLLDNFHVDYTYHFNLSRFSIIDHFIIPSGFRSMLQNVSVIHNVDNLSDHEPISVDLNLDIGLLARIDRQCCNRPAWYKATAEQKCQYAECVSSLLHLVQVPSDAVLCKDANCTNPEHQTVLSKYCHDIAQCCLNAGAQCIPSTTVNTPLIGPL